MKFSKRRLCIVSPCHWTGGYGGSEQQIAMLLDVLISQDQFDVTYLTRQVDRDYKPEGYKIENISFRPMTMRVGNLIDAKPLFNKLNEIQPHVIYQRVGGAYTGIAAYYAKKKKCKLVWHISSDMNVTPFWIDKNRSSNIVSRYIEKKILEYGIRNSSTIIAQTRHQADMLAKYYGISITKVISNYQPIPELHEKSENIINVIWISNLKPMKRPELFIKLAEHFQEYNNVRFIMIGRPENSAWCNKIIESLANIPSIEYLEEKSQEDVNKILGTSHILVNTSSYEGFPNTFIQAWMREVPVVSLEVDPDNILYSQNTGFYSGTVPNLYKHVARLIKDDHLRKDMGQRARAYAIQYHSKKNINDIIYELTK